ncbi:MAG TPA: isocitrate lyase/PEP mutase family protein [Gemmatimonadales bacterium]|jgi:2-methylisocitrate lyase-like PEP mutase family enzyme
MELASPRRLRERLAVGETIPFIGVYDVFSASLAARHYDCLFLSGFSFAASYYGLPDIGYIAWSDLVAFVHRVRALLPTAHLLVDIDDGYGDPEVACHVVSLLEAAGASGVILEDQQRPRRCGHLDGKQVLPLNEYISKLTRVLETRREMVIVARTDASDVADIRQRVRAFEAAGADAILADGLKDLALIRTLRADVSRPLAFNQISGGKSPRVSLRELGEAGVSLAIFSTPCLFAAQAAVDSALGCLKQTDGVLPDPTPGRSVGLKQCVSVLEENVIWRNGNHQRNGDG